MDFVTSADGTRIGYEISGTGSPIVLVGGACYGAKAWAAVAGFLAPHHTVYAVDRRGRGVSGDSDTYAVEREIEDIRAVLDEIGVPVELFGHSSGGLLSLRVAQSGASVSRMTLYEPPLRVPGGATADGITPRLVEALAEEDREQALTMFLVEAAGVEERLLEPMKRTPFWPAALAVAHTLPYDTRLADESGVDGLASLDIPALLLLGDRSPRRMRTSVEALADALPVCRLELLPNQLHNALREAPDLLADRVLANKG
jgi:pimeloyl-ACP methyl ester carboxylesterase